MPQGLFQPKALLPLSIILLSGLFIFLIFQAPQDISFKSSNNYAPAVETLPLNAQQYDIPVFSRGFIQPEQEIMLSAQVAGQVTSLNRAFENGADFKRGDVLLEIDNSRLKLEQSQALAQLQQARVNQLELEAKVESSRSQTKRSSPLAQGKPQLEAARAQTAAAQAQYNFTSEQLQHSKIRAPFNGRVKQRLVQNFDQVAPGKVLANIYATDSFILQLAINEQQFQLLNVASRAKEIRAVISQPEKNNALQAHIIRYEKQLSKSQQIILTLKLDAEFNADVLPGSLFNVSLFASADKPLYRIPYNALRSQEQVWIAKNDLLEIRDVNIFYKAKDYIYIDQGLHENEQLVVSQLAQAHTNMPIRILANTNSDE